MAFTTYLAQVLGLLHGSLTLLYLSYRAWVDGVSQEASISEKSEESRQGKTLYLRSEFIAFEPITRPRLTRSSLP